MSYASVHTLCTVDSWVVLWYRRSDLDVKPGCVCVCSRQTKNGCGGSGQGDGKGKGCVRNRMMQVARAPKKTCRRSRETRVGIHTSLLRTCVVVIVDRGKCVWPPGRKFGKKHDDINFVLTTEENPIETTKSPFLNHPPLNPRSITYYCDRKEHCK